MKGDIALAGFVMTVEEWRDLDPKSREQLVAAVGRDEPWVVSPVAGVLAEGTGPQPKLPPGPEPASRDDDPMVPPWRVDG